MMDAATDIQLRAAVRRVLNSMPGRGFTENSVRENVGRAVRPFSAPQEAVRRALEWNLGKGYARSRTNEDLEEKEFLITAEGAAKEEIR